MAVNLSPVGGVAAQFFDNAGNVLTGGKLYTYSAGTTTPQTTYTTSAGNVPWSNPIILDAAGRVSGSGEIWLSDGTQYKFILRDSNDVLIATYDNVNGINSNFVNFTNEQEIQTATAGQTVFNLTTTTYLPGTNSLSVFVDGVNQYGPGAQYAYIETDSDTVTFVNGLHVGALVKFTTSQLNSSGAVDAGQVSYEPPFVNSVTTNVENKLSQWVSVKDFGAVGDGVVDDTTSIQNAYDSASGTGTTIWWPNGTYKTSAAIEVKSNTTTLFSSGAVISPVALASFTQIQFPLYAFGYALFINENFTTSTFDENISYYNVKVIPTTGVFSWYGGTSWNGHFIDSRNVNNLRIQNCYAENMADFCGVLHCENVVISDNYAIGMSNSAYDCWEGCKNVVIRNNFAKDCNNGVNWNAVDTLNAGTFVAENAIIEGNTIIGLCGASAIYVTPLNATAFCKDVQIINNYIDLAYATSFNPNGITVQRSEDILISGNTIRRVATTFSPIIISYDTSLVDSENCIVVNNIIEDSTLTGGGYILAYGINHLVANNASYSSTAFSGVVASDKSTIVLNNNFTSVTQQVSNVNQANIATTPCFSVTIDKTNDLFNFSYSPQAATGFAGGTEYGITATGTNLATAYQITKQYTYVSSAASGTGLALPSANATNVGKEFVVFNQGVNTITLYAPSGATINGGASTTVSTSAKVRVVCLTTNVYQISGT